MPRVGKSSLAVLVLGLVSSLGWAACGKGGSGVYTPTSGAGGGGGVGGDGGAGGALGLGVGETCDGDGQCRSGLTCTDGTCEPAHDKEVGADCGISAGCSDGLFGFDGQCAPGGAGIEGDECVSDADCASGFRCALEGFGATCVAEGMGDLGGDCTTSTDCFGGLACVENLCQQLPPGTPPFGVPFAGVTCADEDATGADALFRIPRPGDTQDFFQLPFPNDVRKEGTSLDLSGFPTPGDALLGFDPVQRYVDAVEANNDGWGMYQAVLLRFSGRLDFDSLQQAGSVALVDLTDGVGLGLFWSYGIGRTNYICHNRMAIRRSEGRTFHPGHTYATYVTTQVTAEGGAVVGRPADLVALLSATAPGDGAVLDHYGKYAPLRQYLADNAIDPNGILNASVFTVGNPRRTVEQLRATIDAGAMPVATNWTRCDTGVASPCPDATGGRACQAADPDFHELHALVELPIFQRGTAPYLQEADGGDLQTNGGAPELVRTEQVCMSLTVPTTPMPVGGFPTVVYAHGTGGHFRTHVNNGVAKSLSLGVSDGQGNTVMAAVLGIDQVQHGPRRNGSTEAPSDLFFNFENPLAALGNPQQGAADQMALYRFVPSVDFPSASPTGTPFNLTSSIAFWGHSQGATHGAIATPYADWAGVVFSGQGGSLKDSLTTKSSPVNIAGMIPFVLQDVSSQGKLPHGRHHPVMELLQLYIDGGDPVAYNNILALEPLAPLEATHMFQLYGLDDTFTTSQTQSAYAGGTGAAMAAHHASVVTVEDVAGLGEDDELPLPVSGNRTINGKVVSIVLRQYAPASGADGHFVAFTVPAANGDALRFLAGALSGVTPQVGQ